MFVAVCWYVSSGANYVEILGKTDLGHCFAEIGLDPVQLWPWQRGVEV